MPAFGDRFSRSGVPATDPRRGPSGKGQADDGSDDRGGPHKGSHTAVAIGTAEGVLGQVRVRACAAQAGRLLAWAKPWPERTWAVEGAGGLGHLLSQQTVAAGEHVLDVPPKLAARVRLPAAGNVNKNDPNDARPVAVAALRSAACLPVRAEDHAAVLKAWAKRHRDLSRAATRWYAGSTRCCGLVPGGVSKRITAGQAARILEQAEPRGAAGAARWILAGQFLTGLRRTGTQRRDVQKKLAAAVRASGTTVTDIFGAGPAVAAAVLGDTGDIARFPSRDRFAAYNGTAPVEVPSGGRVACRLSLRGNRRINHAVHMAAVTRSTTRTTQGRAYDDKKIAEGQDLQGGAARAQAPGQRRPLPADEGRRAPRRRLPGGPGRAPGERLCRQRGRLAPRRPALRPGHSRT